MGCPGAPPHPPPPLGRPWLHPPPPRIGGMPMGPPPLPAAALRGSGTHPGPLRVAQANVTSLRLHWHTVAEWRVDVVLISETRLTEVAQQVCPARGLGVAGIMGGLPWNPRGGGASGMRRPGGILVRQGNPARQVLPPKGAPERGGLPRPGSMALTARSWWGWGGERIPCMPRRLTVSPPRPHNTWRAMGRPPSWCGGTSTSTQPPAVGPPVCPGVSPGPPARRRGP